MEHHKESITRTITMSVASLGVALSVARYAYTKVSKQQQQQVVFSSDHTPDAASARRDL